MKYRKIGDSELEVSAIALGTWVFGGDCWGEADDSRSVRVVEEAVEKGINIIDTAPIYGGGRSEEVIGKAIRNKRKGLVIATKCGLKQKDASISVDLSADFLREELENSLRRLRVETIDLYQCHWPDPKTPLEETFGQLKKFASEGKIRYIGVSNHEQELLKKVTSIAPVISDQMQYSLLERGIEKGLLPFCAEKNISVLSYGSLGGGILTAKYKDPPQLTKGDVKSFFYKYYREPFWSKAREFISTLEAIAGKHGVPTSHAAVNWVLSHTEVASCIVGCRTPEQLKQNIAASDWRLSEEELERIQNGSDRICAL